MSNLETSNDQATENSRVEVGKKDEFESKAELLVDNARLGGGDAKYNLEQQDEEKVENHNSVDDQQRSDVQMVTEALDSQNNVSQEIKGSPQKSDSSLEKDNSKDVIGEDQDASVDIHKSDSSLNIVVSESQNDNPKDVIETDENVSMDDKKSDISFEIDLSESQNDNSKEEIVTDQGVAADVQKLDKEISESQNDDLHEEIAADQVVTADAHKSDNTLDKEISESQNENSIEVIEESQTSAIDAQKPELSKINNDNDLSTDKRDRDDIILDATSTQSVNRTDDKITENIKDERIILPNSEQLTKSEISKIEDDLAFMNSKVDEDAEKPTSSNIANEQGDAVTNKNTEKQKSAPEDSTEDLSPMNDKQYERSVPIIELGDANDGENNLESNEEESTHDGGNKLQEIKVAVQVVDVHSEKDSCHDENQIKVESDKESNGDHGPSENVTMKPRDSTVFREVEISQQDEKILQHTENSKSKSKSKIPDASSRCCTIL